MTEGFRCPCCMYRTLTEEPPGSHEICAVCGWQDDYVQFNDPDRPGGANKVSLNAARANYAKYGASDELSANFVRKPRPEEM